MKQVLCVTEILINPYLGVYLETTYWDDGTVTERRIPKGPIIMTPLINIWGI